MKITGDSKSFVSQQAHRFGDLNSNGGFSSALSSRLSTRTDQYTSGLNTSRKLADALSPANLKSLGGRFDPENMSQDDYDEFLESLQSKGLITKEDMNRIGYQGSMVCVGDGAYHNDGPAYSSLSDANGNLLEFMTSVASRTNQTLNSGEPDLLGQYISKLCGDIAGLLKEIS